MHTHIFKQFVPLFSFRRKTRGLFRRNLVSVRPCRTWCAKGDEKALEKILARVDDKVAPVARGMPQGWQPWILFINLVNNGG